MDLNVGAKVDVSPKGGQLVPVILAISSTFFFGAAVWLQSQGKSYELAGGVGVAFFGAAIALYLVSHKNSDLQRSHAFGLTVGSGGNQVVVKADPRSMPSLDYIKGMLSHINIIFSREPLPEASGMIDELGKPIENSVDQARDVTDRANVAEIGRAHV